MTLGRNYLMWWVNLYLIHFSKIQAQCTGNGLMNSCACNFINACKYDASTKTFVAFSGSASDLNKLIPDVRSFASTSQVAQICEPGSIGIIYDCINRIPLAATIVMTADQYESTRYGRPSKTFRESSLIGSNFQQNKIDYKGALQRVPCLEIPGNCYIEHTWYRALTGRTISPYTVRCPTPTTTLEKSPIHRGHLIAASYGRGTPARIIETFLYTNAVPQFARENSGSWRTYEQYLITWATKNCGKAPLHVIVGSIPSTYAGNDRRFFGEAGFSNFPGPSNAFLGKQPYRVNVPAFMWTAACCHSSSFTRSTAFFAPNEPEFELVNSVELSNLFSRVRATHVDLFPGMPSCNNDRNYIGI